MNTLGVGPPPPSTQVASYAPVGKPAVGLEDAKAKDEALPPVEEGAQNAQLNNRKPSSREEHDAEEQAKSATDSRHTKNSQQADLDEMELQEVRELAARDREVRAHEAAHSAVGGSYAGGPQYSYQRGPDGVNYAVAGEVPISLPSSSDPEMLLEAAEIVRRAALAPAQPSAQDFRVAASAERMAQQARAELAELQRTEREEAEAVDETEESGSSEIEAERSEEIERQREEAREERQQTLRDEIQQRVFNLNERLITLDLVDQKKAAGAVLDQLI